ncbi:MAG TPA: ISL3 family transposase [Blastocatellia bacterium]|nr:ISL3 family transposase [Blastocatellia bacterium]
MALDHRVERTDQAFRDLPSLGKASSIVVKRKRYRCRNCGATFLLPLKEMDERRQMTARLVDWIKRESIKRTFASIAAEAGVDEKTVRNLFHEYTDELAKQYNPLKPKWLGLDEIHLIRKPRAIITNLETRTVVEMLKDREKATLEAYFATWGWPDLWSVKVVAMDMWRPYRDLASKAFPQATLVVDKFHVLRLTNFCMDQIRKEVKGELPHADRRSLRKDRFILLRRTKELSMKEVLFKDMWLASLPDLAEAYRLKEAFYDIYDASSRALAERLYENWKESIPPGRVKTAFTPLLMACKNWHAEIFNYFDHRQTNATTEALNSLVRHAHRAGRGYSFEAIRAKMLYREGVRLRRKPPRMPPVDARRMYETIDLLG